MTFPPQEKFMRAVHPDPVEAFGYPFGALIVAKVKKDWGLFHRSTGLLVYWYKTRAEACGYARQAGHWPSFTKIKVGPLTLRNEKLLSRIGGALRAHGIIPPRLEL